MAPADNLHSKPVPASEGRQALVLPSKRSFDGTSEQDRHRCESVDAKWEKAGEGSGAPQARPALPAVPVSSRLDTGTSYDQESEKTPDRGYRMVVRDYGQGLVEASITIKTTDKRRRSAPDRTATSEHDEENRDRAIRRAKTAVRQSIMAAQLDHLLTLTYRANQQSGKLAWEHFAKFTRLIRKWRCGRPYSFVAVLERQKRGAMHIHMAVHGHQNAKALRAMWHQAIGSPEGNIDVAYKPQHALPKMARYLSKYITKDIDVEHENGDHRYKRSRNIEIPKIVAVLPFHIAVDSKLIELFDQRGTAISFYKNNLDAEGPKWLWACSW